VVVLDPADFGLLIKTLRCSGTDNSGNRWTRESLCNEVNLSPDQLGRIERGERKYLDNQTLHLLASAFKLTNLERKEFLYASIGIPDSLIDSMLEPLTQLNNMITLIESLRVPTFVIDVYSDLVISNQAALYISQLTPETLKHAKTVPAGLNHLFLFYSPDYGYREMLGKQWQNIAMQELLLFRHSSLRYRHTEYFNYLLQEFLKDKTFDINWYSSHKSELYNDMAYASLKYEHPAFGPVNYIATETAVHTKKGDLRLIIFNPVDSFTTALFADLTSHGNNRAVKLNSWPEKIIP
jgi:transcriptional regulator with XRE-family HTH domain